MANGILPVGCFNPHTHAGCDNEKLALRLTDNVSIHTPTQGVTEKKRNEIIADFVSIHTPTQGVTKAYPLSKTWNIVSIHTPTQGVT